ncbi:hypothetical protein QG37_03571 [Candidozyma auris]|nr:hypothetical protein QG37_03571 [[Candida] auris]
MQNLGSFESSKQYSSDLNYILCFGGYSAEPDFLVTFSISLEFVCPIISAILSLFATTSETMQILYW